MIQTIIVTVIYLLYRLYDSRVTGEPIDWPDVGARLVFISCATYIFSLLGS